MLDDGIHVDNVILSETLNRLVVKLEENDKETFQKPRLHTIKCNFTFKLPGTPSAKSERQFSGRTTSGEWPC